MPKRTLTYIDLFSGAGGLSQGFRQASDDELEFRSVFAVEIEPAFAASYKANFGHDVFQGSIESLRREKVPSADLVIGGPPCQGFSPLGKMSLTEEHPHTVEHPKLNKLWRDYLRVVNWIRPKAFVIENVPEFLRSDEFIRAKRIMERKYRVADGVLNAVEFGVPQKRRRGFVIAIRRDLNIDPTLPKATVDDPSTVRDCIWDLRERPLVYDFKNGDGKSGKYLSHTVQQLHIGRNPTAKSLQRYAHVPPGGNRFDLLKADRRLTPMCWRKKKTGSTDVFGRLEWDKPALTIRTEFFKPEKGCFLHPELHRPITHLEAALIQTFPETFRFCGTKTEIARQIGNAVPPKLGEAVARHLRRLLLAEEKSCDRRESVCESQTIEARP